MKYLPMRDGGYDGASDGIEIKFNGGESTIIAFNRGKNIEGQVESCCGLNEVPVSDVLSVQVIKNCLFC